MQMVKWSLLEDIHIFPLNLGIHNEQQVVKLNDDLGPFIIEKLLKEYKDVFIWTYKDLRDIPPHLA
jgi:hypothetical protein